MRILNEKGKVMETQKLILQRGGIYVTLKCTLRCKICISNVPFYEHPPHFSYKRITQSLERYFQIIDKVNDFSFTGGEPFIHENLPELIDFTTLYFHKYDGFQIITNGTILPSNRLIKSLKNNSKIRVLIDYYGDNEGVLSAKAYEISDLLLSNEINNSVRVQYGETAYHDGWVDLTDLRLKNYTVNEARDLFGKCVFPQKYKFVFPIFDGIIYACEMSRICIEKGLHPPHKAECLDLFDDSLSLENKRDWFRSIYKLKFLRTCHFCDGFTNDRKRYNYQEQLIKQT